MSQGKVVWENEELHVEEGAGRFIKVRTLENSGQEKILGETEGIPPA